MKVKFPEVIYCTVEEGLSKGETFLAAYKNPEEAAEVGETVECAIYKRVRVAKIHTGVKVL